MCWLNAKEEAESRAEIWRQLPCFERACIPPCLRGAKWKDLIKHLSVVTLTSKNTPDSLEELHFN